MKAMYSILFILIICAGNNHTAFSQSTLTPQSTTLEIVKYYEEKYEPISGVWIAHKAESLQKDGVNLKEFCDNVLSDDQLIHFWNKAILFLATHYRQNYPELGREMIRFLQRNEGIINEDVLTAKIYAVVNISGILNPKDYQSQEMVDFVQKELSVFFQQGLLVDPTYWKNYFTGQGSLLALKDKNTDLNSYFLRLARHCLYSSYNLHQLTGEELYAKNMKWCESCHYPELGHVSKLIQTTFWHENFETNQFDLFAHLVETKKPSMSAEEAELQRQRSLEIREQTRKINEERNNKQ